jgi:predicted short-subunit dehydrogenase-like oxidoreductase (DUF2520 family)
MPHQTKKSPELKRRRPKTKPTISIIGAGRLGTTLGRALAEAGYRIQGVSSRRAVTARRAAKLIGPSVQPVAGLRFDKLPDTDVLLITTPDDVIGSIAAQLSRSHRSVAEAEKGNPRRPKSRRRVVLHASGALSSAVLEPLRSAGFAVGSMHPLVSISNPSVPIAVFRGAFFCLEGERMAISVARALARDLGAETFSISTSRKPLYHAAAVMSSGHVVALFDIATEMLVECGLSPARARAVLVPLLQSTVLSLVSQAPAQALTGTFARGEATTAREHLAALKTGDLGEGLAAYKLLGKRALRLAAKKGLSRKALAELAAEIDDG